MKPPDRAPSIKSIRSLGWFIIPTMLLHMVIAGHAASTKSPTFDEPVHLLGGLLQCRYGDYRLNPEHPPLWKFLAGAATIGMPFHLLLESEESQVMFSDLNRQERWAVKSLFRTAAHDGAKLIDRARLVMLLFGAAVVWLVWIWAKEIGGDRAGLVAGLLAALDPNLLAHSGLVTNDVACTAAILACFYCASRLAKTASAVNIALFAAACGLAATIKFTALALPLFLTPIVMWRLGNSSSWYFGFNADESLGISITGVLGRTMVVSLAVLLAGLTSWLSIWAVYGFRYLPTRNPNLSFSTDFPAQLYQVNLLERHSRTGTISSIDPNKRTQLQSICTFSNHHRLLPQAFLQGVGYAQAMSIIGVSYLDGVQRQGGSFVYFLKAWFYKTPISILISVAMAIGWGLWRTINITNRKSADLVFLLLPYSALTLVILSYDLNIGLRHMLPSFPMIWIGLGISGAGAWQYKTSRLLVTALVGVFAIESLSCHPNYLAFFNVVARGKDNGLTRLSDSNLDWGQDLKLLSQWQKANKDTPLYLAYFGSADPEAYEIRYFNLPPGYLYGPPPRDPDPNQQCVLAISATWLQGNYLHWLEDTYDDIDALRSELDTIREHAQPVMVLGGTIYLYDYPLRRKSD